MPDDAASEVALACVLIGGALKHSPVALVSSDTHIVGICTITVAFSLTSFTLVDAKRIINNIRSFVRNAIARTDATENIKGAYLAPSRREIGWQSVELRCLAEYCI